VENTEMEITESVDMEMEDTEVDMAVDIAETIVVAVVVITVREITSLDGLHFHINVDIVVGMLFLRLKMRPIP